MTTPTRLQEIARDVREVRVAGHELPLRVSTWVHECGDITDGVSFEFGDEGSWVVDLEDLRAIVAEADEKRRWMASTKPASEES